jgi:hypothetical protein
MEMVKRMLEAHPVHAAFSMDELADCISHCFGCAQICSTCADACLHEDMVKELARCIRLNLDCADVCVATGKVLSRMGGASDELLRDQLKACMAACDICGKECNLHKHHEHCVICAESCFHCKSACGKMLSGIAVGVP